MSEQPLALLLADDMSLSYHSQTQKNEIATELRRQHTEIEQLKAERDALLAALRPFAALYGEHHKRMLDDLPIFGMNDSTFTVGDMRRANAAIDAARSEV